MKKTGLVVILIAAIGFSIYNTGCNGKGEKDPGNDVPAVASISYSVIGTYKHDTSAFTEGLLFYNGKLYESTGLEGRSKIIERELGSTTPIRSVDLDKKYFGEGIVIINDTIYQLTYQSQIGFMYSLKDFKKIGEFKYDAKEGWGMTTDGKQIIASDGTNSLYFYEPGTFKLLKTQAVTEAGSLSYNINELEYINGFIYANQWQSPYILKIDPNSGQVVGKSNLSQMIDNVRRIYPSSEYLNGIAYDPTTKKTYVTGKLWPEMYEVQFSK